MRMSHSLTAQLDSDATKIALVNAFNDTRDDISQKISAKVYQFYKVNVLNAVPLNINTNCARCLQGMKRSMALNLFFVCLFHPLLVHTMKLNVCKRALNVCKRAGCGCVWSWFFSANFYEYRVDFQ